MIFTKPAVKSLKILVCDDEKDIREILREAFEEAGFQVVEAFSILESGHFDCIVSDIRMANGDGISFAKKVYQADLKIPFYLMTGFSDYQGYEINDYGVEAIFFKPFAVEEIVEAVALKLEAL